MLRLNELIAVIKMKEALAECPRNPVRTDYVLTLADSRMIRVELEHCGGTLWRHEILHGTPPFAYAFHHGFGECLRVACLGVEERLGSPVVRCEPKERTEEIATLRTRAASLEGALLELDELLGVQSWIAASKACHIIERALGGEVFAAMCGWIDQAKHAESLCEQAMTAGLAECDALRARAAELEAVVRAVAKISPITTHGYGRDTFRKCGLCAEYAIHRAQMMHADECPWALARKALGMG